MKNKSKLKTVIEKKAPQVLPQKEITPEEFQSELESLREDIEKLNNSVETEPEPDDVATIPQFQRKPRKVREPKTDDSGEKPRRERKAIDPNAEIVSAKDIADSLNIDSKVLRRTLRKLQEQGKIQTRDGRWEWPAGHADIETINAAFK